MALATIAFTKRARVIGGARCRVPMFDAFLPPRLVLGRVNLSEFVVAHWSVARPGRHFCNVAVNVAAWLHRFYPHGVLGPSSLPQRAMGFGVPAAVAAKIHPRRSRKWWPWPATADFLMTAQELATAVQYGPVVIIPFVDKRRLWAPPHPPERDYPDG